MKRDRDGAAVCVKGEHSGCARACEVFSSLLLFSDFIERRQSDVPARLPDDRDAPFVRHPAALTPFGESLFGHPEFKRDFAQELPVGAMCEIRHTPKSIPQIVGSTTAFLWDDRRANLATFSRHGREYQ